jgi:hypothetical protein
MKLCIANCIYSVHNLNGQTVHVVYTSMWPSYRVQLLVTVVTIISLCIEELNTERPTLVLFLVPTKPLLLQSFYNTILFKGAQV